MKLIKLHLFPPAIFLLIAMVALLAGCGVPAAAGPADTFGLDFTPPAGKAPRGAIVFVIDGLSGEVFQDMLSKGELPAFKKYFVDRGLYCPHTAANVPSVTLPNLTSIVTGRFPGHHNITGINWFDRNRLIWRNYATIAEKNSLDSDYTAATIYECFPDDLTFSVFFQPHRGATKFIENWTSAGPPFFFGWYEFIDRLTLSRFELVMDISRKRGRFPAVTFAYLLAPDFRAYGYGADSPQYRDAIRHSDRQIGRVLGDIERAGLLDKIYIALVADHSHTRVTQHLDLDACLQAMGISPSQARDGEDEKIPFEQRVKDYGQAAVVRYGSGERYSVLCLRRPVRLADGRFLRWDAWLTRPTPDDIHNYPLDKGGAIDLPEALVKQAGIDVVAWQAGDNRVRVLRKGGMVEFRQDSGPHGPITYHLLSGDDPLEWKGKVPADALNGKPLTPRQWLDATIGTQFPDCPAQLIAFFRANRAGDIAIFAAPGFDFNRDHKSGHGGLRPGDMLTPMCIAGPGIPTGRLDAARTADLMPTLLKLLGKPVPPGLDGEPVAP